MKRQHVLLIAALIAFIGSVVGALATIQERDRQLRGYVDATRISELPFRVPRLGVNAELSLYSPDELEQQLQWMEQAHVYWIRQIFSWNELEPVQGEYEWAMWDPIVRAVEAHPALRLVAVLQDSPTWTRTNGISSGPPDDPADFAHFAQAFAQRYGPTIDYYQIWDEPNLAVGWGELEPNAADYAALLQAAFNSIHSEDSGATVIAAGLAPTSTTGPQTITDVQYLRALYAYGAKDFADAFAAKPYGFDFPPDDRITSLEVLNFSRIILLREVMLDYDDGTTPLWASHWGWNALPEDWSGSPSVWGQVSKEQQIQYTLQALNRAEREWPWLGGMILQHWQPSIPATDPQWGFAIIGQNGEPTALWNALTNFQLPNVASNGLYPPQNPFARYSGIWSFSPFGADIGWVEDSRVALDFSGSDVALQLHEDNYVAYLYATVDGNQANAPPRDADGNAYIVLTSDTLEPALSLIPVSRNLEAGNHTLRLVADELVPDEATNRWALVGFAVSSGNLAAPYNHQLTIAWLTAAITGVAVIVTSSQLHWRTGAGLLQLMWEQINSAAQIIIGFVASLALVAGMMLTWGDAVPNIFRREPVQLALSLVTAGLIYLEPGIVVSIVAATILFVIVYHRIEIGLLLTLFWAPFFLFPVELYRFSFPLVEIIIVLTTSAWILRTLVEYGRDRQLAVSMYPLGSVPAFLRKVNGLDYVVILWLILGAVSLIWAEHRSSAITEFRTMMLQPALLYLILRTTHLNRQSYLRMVDALLLAGFMVAVIGFFQYARGEAVITAEDGARRLASVYGSPNNVGLFLGRCIPFALAFAIGNVDRRRRAAATGILIVMGIASLLSGSAGALFIGIPISIVLVLALSLRKQAIIPIFGLLILFVVGFGIAAQSARFSRILDLSQGTNFYRIRVWQSAINIISDHPITGIGLDQFLYHFRGEYIRPDAWEEPALSHPHNFVLDFWVRLGVAGVAVFVVLQALFWRRAIGLYQRRRNDPLTNALVIGLMGSMLNLLAHGLVDNSVYVIDLAYVFTFLLALNVRLSNISAIDES